MNQLLLVHGCAGLARRDRDRALVNIETDIGDILGHDRLLRMRLCCLRATIHEKRGVRRPRESLDCTRIRRSRSLHTV